MALIKKKFIHLLLIILIKGFKYKIHAVQRIIDNDIVYILVGE